MSLTLTNPLRPALLAAARSERIERTVSRSRLTRSLVTRFVPGAAEDAVMDAVRKLLADGRAISVDYLGEDISEPAEAEKTVNAYLSLHVYDDSRPDAYADALRLVDQGSAYGLTGALIADDRTAIVEADHALRFAAGNFYVNDKPTGAVVGQQPFGGGRASGTNDKAGSPLNLLRWTSARTVKETFVPARNHLYPHQS